MNTQKTKLSICADDYGITEKVSEAIVDLVSMSRITETSCMITRPNIKNNINSLLAYKNDINIGLHLTLTDFDSITKFNADKKLPTYKNLLLSSLKKDISINLINDEINSQLDSFENIFGFSPNFIDGHHHVQQLPIINDCLIKIVKDRYLDNNYWIRNSGKSFTKLIRYNKYFLKTFALSVVGNKFKKKLNNNTIKTNDGFSGIYDFSYKTDYKKLFSNFFDDIKDNHLLMVHPGYSDSKLEKLDNVTLTRNLEYDFLSSNLFIEMLNEKNLEICSLFKV